jgi:hypothetical protein
MFTIKVNYKRAVDTGQKDPDGNPSIGYQFSSEMIEAKHIYIYELAEFNGVIEVTGETIDGGSLTYYVANPNNPRPAMADDIEFAYKIYIENSAGKTTEVVGW